MSSEAAQPLVSPSWLKDRLDSTDVVVLDGTWLIHLLNRDATKEFEDAHIKGARFFDIDVIADRSSKLPHMLPTATEFAEQVGALGISNDTHVVVYDANTAIGTAPRVVWTFRAFGHKGGISVLEGGLPAWKAAGFAVESGPAPAAQPRKYIAKLNAALVRTFEQVHAAVQDKTALIVDARPFGRFAGTEPEPRPVPSGHIPGSVALPSNDVLDSASKAYLRGEELLSVFGKAGVDIRHGSAIHSCGSGVNASVNWLATIVARLEANPAATWEQVEEGLSIYDGSWTEWAQREKDGAVILTL
ncbi:3-mercaptopyruvate sulfurtransferase [Zopfochytrium polystomum]|nr:3-mercaptopyruvate sulfurtransferase [Zopfochytrium polystomum]